MGYLYDERGNRVARMQEPGIVDAMTGNIVGVIVLGLILTAASFFIFYYFVFQLGRVGWGQLRRRMQIIGVLVCLLFGGGVLMMLPQYSSAGRTGDALLGIAVLAGSAAAAFGFGRLARQLTAQNEAASGA